MSNKRQGPPSRSMWRNMSPRLVVTNSMRYDRTRSFGGDGPGVQYAGARDVYNAAGYKTEVTFGDVYKAWSREHIAKRIIDIFPDYTWRKAPVIIDGPDPHDPRDTEFCQAWDRLWRSGRVNDDGSTSIGLDYYVPQLDRVSLMGSWAVMFLGFVGDSPLSQPVERGEFASIGPAALAYTSVFSEANATVEKWDTDPTSPRFGQPLLYTLRSSRGGDSTSIQSVHWTRIIHVANGGLADVIEGQSLLTHVFNLIQDILKIVAGTGESGYRNADPGMVIKTQPAFEAPESTDALDSFLGDDSDSAYVEELKDSIRSYIDGLERYMLLEGFDIEMLTGDMPDPRGPISVLIDLIAAATGIPQRLLMGNEAGELASSQDRENWATVIETRQEKVATPMILRPLVNRLVWAGVLPEPLVGMNGATPYAFNWPSLYSSDPKESAEIAKIVASVLQALGVAVEPEKFIAKYLPDLDPAAILGGSVPPAAGNPMIGGGYDSPTGNAFMQASGEVYP